jgi:quercetin dioxygenase-like cupin family protein
MKLSVLCLAALATVAVFLMAQEAPKPEGSKVVFVGHDKVTEALAKTGLLSKNGDHMVAGAHRNGPGQAEQHDKVYDIVYVTDGEATYITGGKLVNSKQNSPGEWLGGTIDGGEPQKLVKGDLIVVPPGVPHWFKEVPKEVSYFLVKVVTKP